MTELLRIRENILNIFQKLSERHIEEWKRGYVQDFEDALHDEIFLLDDIVSEVINSNPEENKKVLAMVHRLHDYTQRIEDFLSGYDVACLQGKFSVIPADS